MSVADNSRQLLEIQYLRALAALAVVAYHAGQRPGLPFGIGAAGVDVFFVISGFIMWIVTAQRPTTPLLFLRNRLVRIVPLYWCATLGLVVLAAAVPALMPNLRPDAERVLMSLFFVPHRDPLGDIHPVLVPGWTLNYEMFFYLLFALVLALPRAVQLRAMTAILGALVLAGLVLSLPGPLFATYTRPLLLEFLAGMWLAEAWLAGRLPGRAAGLAMMLLGCAMLVALQVTGTYSDPWRVVIWGVPSLLIVTGTLAVAPGGLGRLPLAKWLGDASYSIYLTHQLVVGLMWKGFGWLPGIGFVALCLVASSIIGIASFHLLERPVTEALKRLGKRRAATPQPA